MLSNIFTKTLYERKLSIAIWFSSMLIYSIVIVALFPTFQESFGQALAEMPESMQSLMGNVSDYQNINGFVDIQVINQIVFLTLIMSIILGTSLLAGEESDGTLQTLLTQPVSRTKAYLHKAASLITITFVVSFGIPIGATLGALLIGELPNLDILRTFMASIMIWAITLLFGVISFSIGAITGKKGIAGIAVGALAFTAYMITALSSTANVLERVNSISPFKYFNTPSVIKHGLDTSNLAFFGLAIVLLLIVGAVVFCRRDIYQK